MLTDQHVHIARIEVLKARPAEVLVWAFLAVHTFGKEPFLHRLLFPVGLQFLGGFQFVQALKKKQVEELTVRAGIKGKMQEMTLQIGQRVHPGDVLAKVAQPWKLKAEVKIAETQAKDVLLGQKAEIDTRNGIVPGHVSRIDASIVNGTRTVDVSIDGPLPPGAVPDLSVDGTIVIERVADVVYVARRVFGQPNSQATLFMIDEDGKGATRVPVKFGRGSVNNIEVLEGLKVGDRVILSDMSSHDQDQRIRLN